MMPLIRSAGFTTISRRHSIPAGADFRRILEQSVSACDVMLVIIGDHWLAAADNKGKRRLENPDDFVRVEVEAALSRGMPVIPVLVGAAAMPGETQLPERMRPLAYRNAVRVRPDPDFRNDVQKLVAGVNGAATLSPRSLQMLRSGNVWAKRAAAFFAVVAFVGILAASYCALPRSPERKSSSTQSLPEEFEAVSLDLPNVGPDEVLEFEVVELVYEDKDVTYDATKYVEEDMGKGKRKVPVTVTMTKKVRDWRNLRGTVTVPGDSKLRAYKTRSSDLPFLLVVNLKGVDLASAYRCLSLPKVVVVPPPAPAKMPAPPVFAPPPAKTTKLAPEADPFDAGEDGILMSRSSPEPMRPETQRPWLLAIRGEETDSHQDKR
jgi:hypothetical protein